MQEIGSNVFIETMYAGVTLGVIKQEQGVLLIDAPFLPEDIRSWRSSILNFNGGERLLINLDAHVDRIIGAKAMDCVVVGHDALAQIFQTRPFPYRSQSAETGAEWEKYDNLGTIRWAPPELTFIEDMAIHWDDTPVLLQQCSGAELGALWVDLPGQHVLFLGDLVMPDQPPFLANAQIPAWIETLEKVLEPRFKDYMLVGGRNGLISHEDVRRQIKFLSKVQEQLNNLRGINASESEIMALVPGLTDEFHTLSSSKAALYQRRLQWGLSMYYLKNYFPEKLQETEV